MKALTILLQNRWIIKQDNPQLYYQVKDGIKECKKFVQEKLGYHIIVNPYVIKLEKIPGQVEPWMGIMEFKSSKEYQMFCYLLMFLEDKEVEQQFILSDITEFLQMQFNESEIDWTIYTTRKQLVRVIKYCMQVGLFKENDGDAEAFTKDMQTEALYENTGISRYFMRNLGTDITTFTKPEDFEQSVWFEVDEDRGVVRRQRIYRRLLLSPGVYRDDQKNEDFGYIRNYRFSIEKDFQSILPCRLDVHLSSAYLVVEDMRSMGKVFPKNNAMDEMIAYLFSVLQEQIKKQELSNHEQYEMEIEALKDLLQNAIKNIFSLLPKTYQVKEISTIVQEAIDRMILYGFIESKQNTVLIYPIVGKVAAKYTEVEGTK